jgi:hypothetical protein
VACRRQVDDGEAVVALVAEDDQRPLDAVDALADGGFREADEDGLGQPDGGVRLGDDRDGVDADERERVQLGQHGD